MYKPYKHRPNYDRQTYIFALFWAFRSVCFDNPEQYRILWDSYVLNLDLLCEYARANSIDELEYIKSIHQYLVSDRHNNTK